MDHLKMRFGIRGENGRRLQAIISARTHGISQVAKIYNISRETLMRWISKIKTGGVKNFAVAAGRGRRSKLESKQELELQRYIEEHGAHLNTQKVRVFVKENFDIDISKATVKNKLYDSLENLEDSLCQFINTITPEIIKSLCNVNYIARYL
ncbi:hypothetical protein EDM53_04700 [Rickettsiales endosymbiont of Peranema trichophorum]|nr:hypothetical protein EDM53_04700 [Rickettsiales endosymbiont of Peranema trichophorum]